MNRVLGVALVGALVGSVVYAQEGPSHPPRGTPRYNPATVETISGEVLTVEEPHRSPGRMVGVMHVMLRTDKETIAVHLAPAWYLQQHKTVIQAKDRLEVRGSRTTCDAQPCIVAAEIKAGEQSLTLRETNGYPRWRGPKANR